MRPFAPGNAAWAAEVMKRQAHKLTVKAKPILRNPLSA
jgi:hypothetical protein